MSAGERWWQPRPDTTAHLRGPSGTALCGNLAGVPLLVAAPRGATCCGSCKARIAAPLPRHAEVVAFPAREWPNRTAQWRAVQDELVALVRRYAGHGARDTATALSIDHVDRGDGRCAAAVCGGARDGGERWPCGPALLAMAAHPEDAPAVDIPAQRAASPAQQRIAS